MQRSHRPSLCGKVAFCELALVSWVDGRLGFMTAATVQYLMLCVGPSHGERQVSHLEEPPELLIAVYGV